MSKHGPSFGTNPTTVALGAPVRRGQVVHPLISTDAPFRARQTTRNVCRAVDRRIGARGTQAARDGVGQTSVSARLADLGLVRPVALTTIPGRAHHARVGRRERRVPVCDMYRVTISPEIHSNSTKKPPTSS